MSIIIISLLILFSSSLVHSQGDSISQNKTTISLSGFIDSFYTFDFNKPKTSYRQSFLFNHNRHNEFNINLALLNFKATHKKYRASIALQSGTYADDNYANESSTIKLIHEAYVGVLLNEKRSLWLEMGIIPSHIGFESALSIDNPTLTRSLVAESSPYFLAGAKLSYKINSKLDISAIICNGWQRIKRIEGSSIPSFGSQLKYTNQKLTFNYSIFIGTDYPDTNRRMRYFNNIYSIYTFENNLQLTAGFDFGFEEREKNSSHYNHWFSPIVILKKSFSNYWKAAARIEYFSDKNQVIIVTNSPEGFNTFGYSINGDYIPYKNVNLRLEGRLFSTPNRLFINGNPYKNFFISTSIAIKI